MNVFLRVRANSRIALAFASGGILTFIVWLCWPHEGVPIGPVPAATNVPPSTTEEAKLQRPEVARPSSQHFAPSIREAFALTAEEVLDNPDCQMLAGRGRAKDKAIVILPTPEGARFAVLDGQGEVFADTLPFFPHHYHLGKRADGTVLAGFGDPFLNSRRGRERHAPEPVRIYFDGTVVYESDKASEFAIAPDGSSFYVREPLAGGASRLVVRNLDLRTERHFALGGTYTPSNEFEPGFGTSFAVDAREIMFWPVYEYGRGIHRFYPVGDSEVREVHVAQRADESMFGGNDRVRVDGVYSAVFASSEEAYFAAAPTPPIPEGTKPWKIERRKLDHDTNTSTEVWSRELDLDHFGYTMNLSDDGAWLAVRAWNFQVLNTASGETVFEYPMVDKQAELARLGSVLVPGATVRDVGAVTNDSFRDNRLVFFRQVGSKRSCSGGDKDAYDDCIAELRRRGIYNSMVDVFQMETIEIDSEPDFRVEVSRDNRCGSGDYALRGLQVHDGHLTFLTTTR